MDSKSTHKLIKNFLKKSKKTSCNLLVSTVATTSILGAMSVSGNTLTNAGLQTVQASTENAKDGKNAKLTKKSYIYNNRGKRTIKKALKKSKSVKVYGTKVIKGKIYYNLGHECYVLAKDVKIAKTVKVTKNAYVYNSQGKRISKKALKKGQNLEVYGTKTIKGKKYYALGNGGYVPVNNVKVPKATETPSPTVGDNSNGTTPNKPDNSGSNIPNKPDNGSSTIPNKPDNGSSTTPNKPDNGSSTTPNKPDNGSSTTPNKPDNGSSTTPNKPDNGSSTTPNKPDNSGSTIPNKPDNGSSTTPNKPDNSGSTTPNKPDNGSSTTPNKPDNGGSTTPNKPDNGGSTTPNKPDNGSSTTPNKPDNSGSTIPNKPDNGSSTTPNKPDNSGSTTPNKPDNGSASNSSSKNVHPASIKLPSGYTRDRLVAAYMAGYPSATNVDSDFVKVCKQGMENNTFDSSNDIDQAGDDTISVDPTNLTKDQQAEISSFALRLINGARADLGLKPWISSTGTQKLANDIATEYTSDQWSGYANGHDVNGIIRAAKKNGLNIDKQYIEDLYSPYGITITTMSELKKVVYQGLTMMIFGGVNASTNPNNPQNCEWHHAGDLLGTMGNHRFDDEDFYFGISISKTSNKEYDIHYINVSSYLINGSYGQDHHSTFNPGKDQNGKDIIVPTLKEIVSKKFSIVDFRQEFLKKINDSREKDSLAPVVENEKITEPNNLIDVVEGPFSDNSKLTADKFFLSGDNYYMNPNIKEIWINAKVLETGEIRCEVSVSYN